MPFGLDENRYVPVFAGAATARFRRCFRAQPVQLYARHTKIWISQGADRISTASGSERPLAKIPLATARGTDSSPESISWYAEHIGIHQVDGFATAPKSVGQYPKCTVPLRF